MADVITRLKLESGEYDAKIARAVQGLKGMEAECRSVNGTLAILEKDQKEYVQSLGQMQTVSNTVRGKIGELSSAYTELAVQYRHLTDEEKKGDFGQALSQSLDQLKNRIQESKTELADVTRELNGMGSQGEKSGGILDSLSEKFGLSTQQLVTWGGAIAAGKAALEVMKGAIESTEATHDTYARAVAAADSVTNQFLRSLATADFSNFISGLDDIIRKATEAYNTLDEFQSFAARFNPHQQAMEAKIQTRIQQARAAKAQGDIARANQLIEEARTLTNQLEQSTREYGRKQTAAGYSTIRSLMGGVDITDQQIAWYADPKNWDKAKQKAEEYKRITEEIARLGEKNITSLSYDQQSRRDNRQQQQRLEAQLQRDPSLKRAYTMLNLRDSGDGEQAKALNEALLNIHGNTLADSRIESLRARVDRLDGTLSNTGNITTPKTTVPKVDIPEIKPQTLSITVNDAEALKAIQKIQGITIDPKTLDLVATDNATSAIDKVEGVEFTPKTIEIEVDSDEAMRELNKIEGISITIPFKIESSDTESMAELIKQMSTYKEMLNNAKTTEEYNTAIEGINRTKRQQEVQTTALQLGRSTNDVIKFEDSASEQLNKQLNETFANMDPVLVPIVPNSEDFVKEGNQAAKSWAAASTAVSGIGNALKQIEDPAAKIFGIIAQAVANVAAGFAGALARPESQTGGVWGWIAAAAAGTATMISTIAAIKSATDAGAYAEGGIIPGNSYSGDRLTANVNSGELILNRAQQDSIANQLTTSDMSMENPVSSQPYVSGEKIFLGLSNYLRASGRGELITSRR